MSQRIRYNRLTCANTGGQSLDFAAAADLERPTSDIRQGLRAGLVASLVSGAPSTLYSIAARRDPLEATLAAGSMVLPDEERRAYLVSAAIPVHFALSAFWGVALARFLPRKRRLLSGSIAGLMIGFVDLFVVGRRFPRIRALPTIPQLADHVAFGVTVARMLGRSPS